MISLDPEAQRLWYRMAYRYRPTAALSSESAADGDVQLIQTVVDRVDSILGVCG